MHPILFSIGPFTLHTYGLLIGLGFVGGYLFSRREFTRRNIPVDLHDSLALILLVSGFFGARLFYFALVHPEFFLRDPFAFVRVWEGGLVYYGGFAGGLAGLWWFSRHRKIPFLVLGDAMAGGLLLAQAVGRLGCFSAGCCYGRVTDAWWGITFNHQASLAPLGVPLIPTQLLSSAGNLFLFFGAWVLAKRNPAKGVIVCFYLLGYGLFRFGVEWLRSDFRGAAPLGLHPSQWISLAMIATGGGLLYVIQRNARR